MVVFNKNMLGEQTFSYLKLSYSHHIAPLCLSPELEGGKGGEAKREKNSS